MEPRFCHGLTGYPDVSKLVTEQYPDADIARGYYFAAVGPRHVVVPDKDGSWLVLATEPQLRQLAGPELAKLVSEMVKLI